MNRAAHARIAAYGLACSLISLAVWSPVLTRSDPTPSPTAAGREALQRAEAALAAGDVRGARQAWDEAYQVAMQTRQPDDLLGVGHAYLRIGAAGTDRSATVARARGIYLAALFQARERRDAHAVARAGEAFAALGDHEVAERAFDVAMALAAQRRDAAVHDRIAALRARAGYATPTR